jgi:hypothetical protein
MSFDDHSLGDELKWRLRQQIEQRNRFVVILSEASLQSDWVKFEVECAFQKKTSEPCLICPIWLKPQKN